MISIICLICLVNISSSLAKMTYFNLENIYGPYCNAQTTYTPDAGIVRYAGTPWTGSCVLNLQSCCFPIVRNSSLMGNLSVSTKFYIHLLKPPLCSSENVTIKSESGEKITIDCTANEGSEYYLDTEKLTITYDRRQKFPLSPFAMVVTPLKVKTRMYTACGFDCFSETHCIDRSLLCDRYKNCPNNVDESQCEYNHIQPPMSFQLKVMLLGGLLMILSFDVSSILICYFCCGAKSDNNLHRGSKEGKQTPLLAEEGAVSAAMTPLLQ